MKKNKWRPSVDPDLYSGCLKFAGVTILLIILCGIISAITGIPYPDSNYRHYGSYCNKEKPQQPAEKSNEKRR